MIIYRLGLGPYTYIKMALNWKRFVAFVKELVICRILLVTGFLIDMVFILVLQLIGYLAIRPWSKQLFRNFESCVFSNIGLNNIAFIFQWWSQSKLEVLGDPSLIDQFGKENALLIFNHKYAIDFFTIYNLTSHFGALRNLKWFAKKSVADVPAIGQMLKVNENVFLERVWEKDKDTLGVQLTEFLDQPEPRIFALFPEGTRFTQDKHKVSMAVAKDKGLEELKHHLLPRTKGFVECMKVFRRPGFPQVAIYDGFVAISRNNEGGNLVWHLLKGKGIKIKIFLKRFALNEIPREDVECANWVHERFQEKDRMMENFLKTGNLVNGDEENAKDFQVIQMKPQISVLAKFILWNRFIFGILGTIVWKLYLALGAGPMGIIVLAVSCLGEAVRSCYLGVVLLNNEVKMEKSSSHGTELDRQCFVVSEGG